MTVEECKIMCTHHSIDLREKIFFRIIYETQLRPFEVLNLQVEQWDRKQGFVTALKVKQKTKPRKGDHHAKDWLPSTPKTRAITLSTNEMLREYVSNRKKGPIFINENEEMLSLEWFNQEISRYAKLLGIQKWHSEKRENVTMTMLEAAGNYLRLQRITQCKLKKSTMRKLGRILNR
jgi:site-specific recombinase XerD